jgi:ABC-type glycerol-3-phosphate transport system substrate-binding protein
MNPFILRFDLEMPQLILTHSQNSVPSSEYIQQSLKQYGFDLQWQHQLVSWNELRTFLRDATFKRAGAEIAQVGSTWVSGLTGMQALRPFTPPEILRIQRAGNFVSAAWNTSALGTDSDKRVWSIPWSKDVRIIYYWADMFEQAQVDPQLAFSDPASFEAALGKLQASGIETPWIACTAREVNTVHHVSMWIWQHGGELLSQDGREVLFAEASALEGIKAYFHLHRFMPSSSTSEGWRETDVINLFQQRKVACVLSGAWVVNTALSSNPQLFSRLRAAIPPATPFIGGTNLVVMNHLSARYEQSAINLILHLTSKEFITNFAPMAGYDLPARADVLEEPPFVNNPFMPVLVQALQVGRSIPNILRWSIVEDKLTETFAKIWMEIKCQPEQPLNAIISEHLKPLAQRLNRTLAT